MNLKIGDAVKFTNGVEGIIRIISDGIDPISGKTTGRGRMVTVAVTAGYHSSIYGGRYNNYEADLVGSDLVVAPLSVQVVQIVSVKSAPASASTPAISRECGCGALWGECDGNSPYCG